METYGRYQLMERLATGGMAQIFLAREPAAERPEQLLVVKRLLPHLSEDGEFVRMFLDEARIAARLNHSNIVQIFNLGAQDDSYFIAMEYLHGEDVRRVWMRAAALQKQLPVPLLCRIIIEACAGLDYAHKRTDAEGRPLEIVHRDVSPQNLIVTFKGEVKVVDFGIAKAAGQATVTRSGVLKGKYSYMSPEQSSGKPLDARSDVFSLGIILHELLTGQRLFKRATDLMTLAAVASCEVPKPSSLDARVPSSLDPVVLLALALSPDQRYPDARAFQVALESWLRAEGHQAGAAELSVFMRSLYAERLAHEESEGRVLVVPSLSGEDEAAADLVPPPPPEPSGSMPSTVTGTQPSLIGPGARARMPIIAPELPVKRAHRPAPARAKLSRGVALGAVVLALAGLALVGGLRRPFALARVTLRSEPAGATVLFNGQALPRVTPCELPPVPAGRYSLILGKAGFRDQPSALDIPAGGELSPPVIVLQAATERDPLEKSLVRLSVRSTPSGALLFVDGLLRGPTPVVLRVPQRAIVALHLEQPGFRDLERMLQVGDRPEQQLSLTLERSPF